MLTKEIKLKPTSRAQILSKFSRSTSSTKLHSIVTLRKLVFWQNWGAILITFAAVQRGLNASTPRHKMQLELKFYCYVSRNQTPPKWASQIPCIELGNMQLIHVNLISLHIWPNSKGLPLIYQTFMENT